MAILISQPEMHLSVGQSGQLEQQLALYFIYLLIFNFFSLIFKLLIEKREREF